MKTVYNKYDILGKEKMQRVSSQPPMPNMPYGPVPPSIPNVVKVESSHHTLFISDVPEELLPVNLSAEDGKALDEIPEQLWIRREGRKLYTLYIRDFEENEKGLSELFYALRDAGPSDELEIRISSPGGYISELISFRSVLKEVFNGRVTTILDSYGYSCGAFIFCMGDRRVISEFSEAMFHTASFGAWGETYKVKAQHDFVQSQLERFAVNVMKPYFGEKEIDDMLQGKDFWMDAKEMAGRGLADEVIVDGIPLMAVDYLNLLQWEEMGETKEDFFDTLFQEGGDEKVDEILNPPKRKTPAKKKTTRKATTRKTTNTKKEEGDES